MSEIVGRLYDIAHFDDVLTVSTCRCAMQRPAGVDAARYCCAEVCACLRAVSGRRRFLSPAPG